MARKEARPTEYKTVPAISLKVNEEQGVVEHIITLFGILDHGNDISHPGSFAKTIAERGNKVQVLDMHKTDSIRRILGKPLELREVGRDELPQRVLDEYPEATGGLKATTQFFIDTPEGKGAFIRAKEDAVEWSYGYDALDTDEADVKRNGETVRARNLRQVKLWEYGPVIFGMCPGTTTLSAKADEPTESKPAPDVTENTIRIRVRDPGDFDPNAFGDGEKFKVINIGPEAQGIQATIGKLKGETSTTVQGYVFDREKWDVDKAQAWVDEHKKDAPPDLDEKQTTEDDAEALVPTEQDEGPYRCECLECGHVMESEEHCRDTKCPECGGAMRRAERPGPGKGEEKAITDEDKRILRRELGDLSMQDLVATHRRLHQMAAQGNILTGFSKADMNWFHTATENELKDRAEKEEREPPEPSPLEWGKADENLEEIETPEDEEQKHMPGRVAVIAARFQSRKKAVESTQETKEPTEAQVFAAIALENIAAKLSPESWEYKAALLAAEKLRHEWGGADEGKVAELERKVGRVLAARNAQRISAAMTALLQVLEDAGIDIPGFGKEPAKEEEEEEKDYALDIEILGAELDLLELE